MRWRSKHRQVEKAAEDPTSLGCILIKQGFATPDQVSAAVERQLVAAPPLGEILIDMGIITQEQLEAALYEQRRVRGKTSGQEEVQYQLTRQATHMRQVTEGLNDIANISNDLVTKIGRMK